MAISISIETNLKEIQGRTRPVDMRAVRKVAGRAFANQLRAHFFKLNRERPNQLGGRRTGFYAQAARGVQQPELQSDGVKVSVNQVGLAQRLFGGTIRPVRSTYLTIPARAEAHGKRAREFKDLEILWGRRGPVALIQRRQSQLSRGKKAARTEVGGGVFFWLVKSVTQAADPTVLPTETEISENVSGAVGDYLESLQK